MRVAGMGVKIRNGVGRKMKRIEVCRAGKRAVDTVFLLTVS